ncbi:MAG: copper chaperone PCu(A)C [Spirochaetota bacterium]|nr:copper chaperone PCu(A)C [Spirochaetota bacterium]
MKKLNILMISLLSVLIAFACESKDNKAKKETIKNVEISKISVKDQWIRFSPPSIKTTAGYLSIYNHGTVTDTLISAKSDIAEFVELHNMTFENGIMRMKKVDGIDIPVNSSVQLKPGGHHLMFINLKKEIKENDKVKIILTFKNTGTYITTAEVKKSNVPFHKHDHSHGSNVHSKEEHLGKSKDPSHSTEGK